LIASVTTGPRRPSFVLAFATVLLAIAAGSADATHLSREQVAKLVERCEAAREARLKPLREKEIQECERTAEAQRIRKENCAQYFKDYGEARNTGRGVVPRMFHNIAECQTSEEAELHQRMHPQ
jgi:hypothetical protein